MTRTDIFTQAGALALGGLLGIGIFGYESECRGPNPPNPAVIHAPDNTIRLPYCRVIYIGQCPYAWCERDPVSNGTVASLVTLKPHCEPGNVTVSDTKPAESRVVP